MKLDNLKIPDKNIRADKLMESISKELWNNTKDDIRLLKSIEWRYARDNEKMAFL